MEYLTFRSWINLIFILHLSTLLTKSLFARRIRDAIDHLRYGGNELKVFIKFRGVAQLASALAWGARGRPFKSDHPDKEKKRGWKCPLF